MNNIVQQAWDATPENGRANFDSEGNCTCGCPGKPPCEDDDEPKTTASILSSWFSFGKPLNKVRNGDPNGAEDFNRVKSNWQEVLDMMETTENVTLTVVSLIGGEYVLVKVGAYGFRLISLRKLYHLRVLALSKEAEKMRKAGKTSEEIARAMNQARRELGIEFRKLTPRRIVKRIHKRNLKKYNDKDGPTIEWLRARDKSWEEIIDSATRPNTFLRRLFGS